MTIYLPCLDEYEDSFPDVESALTEPDGLLAFGGDLSPHRIINAYKTAYSLVFRTRPDSMVESSQTSRYIASQIHTLEKPKSTSDVLN